MTRSAGLVEHLRNLGPHDHVCWSFDDPSEFRRRAGEFLSDGLASGRRVYYVRPGDPRDLENDLRDVPNWREALRTGAAQVVPLDTRHPPGAVVDPAEQVRSYASATEKAIADGFAGLRVAAEVTTLARSAEQLDAVARHEFSVDRFMARRPFSAMCAYNREILGEQAVAQLACMHPVSNVAVAGFRLHATADPDAHLALAGELDLAAWELFDRAACRLGRLGLPPAAEELIVDGAGLRFIDHRSLLRLAELAGAHGTALVLRTRCPAATRLATILDLENVRVEQT